MSATSMNEDAKQVHDQEFSVDEAWQEFVRYLKSHEHRITQARRFVFDHVFSRHDHFTADQVAAELSHGLSRVSRGTVYHTLALLVKSGMVREIRDSDTHVHYEHVYGHALHEHMICDKCHKFIEFSTPHLDGILVKACADKDFEPRTHRVVIFGTCHNCQK